MPTQYTLEDFRNNLKKGAQRLIKNIKIELTIAAAAMEADSKDVPFSQYKNISGRLRQSTNALPLGEIEGKPAIILQAGGDFRGRNVFYAKFVEFGTKYSRPRLFLGRSFNKNRKELDPKIQKMVTAVLKGDADG